MKKILALLLIVSVSMVSAKTFESKVGNVKKSNENIFLLEKSTKSKKSFFETLGASDTLPPVSCDPTVIPTGCACKFGRMVCYEK